MLTPQEKLDAVERCIIDFREFRNQPDTLEHQTLQALKEIASDLRARQNETVSITEVEIQRRVRSATENQMTSRLVALAHEVIKRWPVIRQALEHYGALEESKR